MNTSQFIADMFHVCREQAMMLALNQASVEELDRFADLLCILEATPGPQRNAMIDNWTAKLSPSMQRRMAPDMARLKAEVAQ